MEDELVDILYFAKKYKETLADSDLVKLNVAIMAYNAAGTDTERVVTYVDLSSAGSTREQHKIIDVMRWLTNNGYSVTKDDGS